MFNWYFKTNLLIRILLGLVLGAVVGLIVGPSISVIQPLGDIFVRLLKMIVIPVVFTSLVVGAASISPARLGRVGVKIVVFYLLTSSPSGSWRATFSRREWDCSSAVAKPQAVNW